MKEDYFESVVMIERLHRLFLEVLKVELDRLDIYDINNVQSLILYNVGSGQVTVGELTNRGYYLGSNVSYNLRKMVTNGYVLQEPSLHDRRSSHVRLSEKGNKLFQKLDSVLKSQSQELSKTVKNDDMKSIKDYLRRLEGFWNTTMYKDAKR